MNPDPASWTLRSPGDLSVELPEVFTSPIDTAVESAYRASRAWARTPLADRIAHLRSIQEALKAGSESIAHLISLETGKPLREARLEMGAVVAKIDFSINDAREHLVEETILEGPHPAAIRRSARGPAAVIGPFNFPIHLAHGAMVAHLLTGNPVLFKPSPLAANAAAKYAAIIAPLLPEGVFQLVQGGAATGETLALHPAVRAVCFTGSLKAGRQLAIATAYDVEKDLALELGGCNVSIICADADLENAAAACADAIALTCGQRCNATSRLFIATEVFGPFVELLGKALSPFQPGDPLNENSRLGPLINSQAVERYRQRLELCAANTLIEGGIRETVSGKKGHYVLPALVHDDQGILPNEELFVPIASARKFDDFDEVIAWHNASHGGLTASVFTRSRDVFEHFAAELFAGNIYANLPTTFSPSTLPFGGWGTSGNRHPGGRRFIRWTTDEQAIQTATASLQ